MIDRAHAIAARPERHLLARSATCCACPARAAICSTLRSRGADVRVVYSPLDAVRARARQPRSRGGLLRHRLRDHRAGQRDGGRCRRSARASANFSMLVSHVLVPPAIASILQAPGNRVQGFLGPGHVCAVMGFREYEALARALSRADRDHRLRAGRPARKAILAGGAPARGRARRGREPVRARRRAATATRAARALIDEVFEVVRPQVARRRRHPEERLPHPPRVPRARRRAALRGRRHRDPRVAAVHQRARSCAGSRSRRDCPAFGRQCTPRDAARRDHGLGRGRVRRLLPVRPPTRAA